jgi:phosphoglycerate dehydrogenase-like enzyme
VEFVIADTAEKIAAQAADAEAAFGPMNSSQLQAAPNLRWIQSPSAGVEWMRNAPELAERDITVCNTRGAHAATIAEHTMGMLVFLTRGFGPLHKAQQRHEWGVPEGTRLVGLVGLKMGIVGLGNIGRQIAKRAAAFEMDVIAVDVNPMEKPDYVSDLQLMDGMPALLRESDVVVVTVPITAETRGMIGPDELALLQPEAFFIVISRGGIIHEPTLIRMLEEGKLAGAALDVAATEPLPADDPLWDAPNLFITPHSSPSSVQTSANVASILKNNLNRFLNGEPLQNTVSIERGF